MNLKSIWNAIQTEGLPPGNALQCMPGGYIRRKKKEQEVNPLAPKQIPDNVLQVVCNHNKPFSKTGLYLESSGRELSGLWL